MKIAEASASDFAARSPSEAMVSLIQGAWLAKALHVAVVLRIPDHLLSGPKTLSELAAATGTHAGALRRLMSALSEEGIFAVDDRDEFSLTPLGATLRTDMPDSLHAWVLLMLGKVNAAAWDDLMHSMRTGQSAFEHRYRMDLWRYCAAHPDYAELFDSAMASFTKTYVAEVLRSYSFSEFTEIVDVGGGDGSLLMSILRQYPDIRGTVFDLPEVADRTHRWIADAGLAHRCLAVGGDAAAEVPPGADGYILSRVLHDWHDDAARRILTNCCKALARGGRVLVIERALPDGSAPRTRRADRTISDTHMTDLNMLVMTTGRERTIGEYVELFRAAGLELVNVVATGRALNVIEARAAG
jgi:predicted O-methyltransferase YrrM